ncbi:MAG: GGDEF domain-containing protein [Epsilonproteobacteria bacterium]|nr:GGDEF domain-containing protein [Campylobacterota bacterium]
MTIKEIAQKALAHFKGSGYVFTPYEYQEVFCKEAKKAGVSVEDCSKVEALIKKLDDKYKKLLANYKVKTLDELAVFLINNLNRENISKEKEFSHEMVNYAKRLLQVIDMLPTKAKSISTKQLNQIQKPHLSVGDVVKMRNEWLDFMTTYDDKLIEKYKKRCALSGDDIVELLPRIIECMQKQEDFSTLQEAIIFTLTPSYAKAMYDEIAILQKELKKHPEFITSGKFADELKILTKKRIKKDKEEFRKKIVDIDKITELLTRKIIHLLKTSSNSSKKIKLISNDIKNVDTTGDFEIIKTKLLAIAESLDVEITKFSDDVQKEHDEVESLKQKVKKLEEELKLVKEEAKTDDLTKMLNKKALNQALHQQEEFYKRHQRIYSILFFDIDHFKNVNDTYGHDAGDVILKSVGLLLNRYSRDIDIVGRFGGEEFVIIAPETTKKEAYQFAEKIRKIVQKTKFMYKDTRIDITISAGVADRSETNSMEETLKLADERLYKAKTGGRNRVEMD